MRSFILLVLLIQNTSALEWLRKAEALIGTDQEYSDRQEEYLKQAVAADPEFAGARFNLGLVHLRRKDVEEALEQFAAYVRLEPGDLKGHLLKARCNLELDRRPDAVLDLKRGLELDPENAEAWEILGSVLYDLERHQEALNALTRALGLTDHRGDILYRLALTLRSLDRSPEALQRLDELLEEEPAHYEGLLLAGSMRIDRKQFEEAVPYLLKAESIDAGDPALARALGNLFLRLDRPQEAVARLQRAEPDSPLTLATRGILAKEAGNMPEAERLLRGSLNQEPFHPLLWGHLADVLIAQDKSLEALAAYDQAIRYDPKDTASLVRAGSIAADNKRQEAALKYFGKALELNPDDGFVHYSLAVVMERLGDEDKQAQSHYLKALSLGEARPFAHFRLIFLFARQAQSEAALKHLEMALQADSKRFYPLIQAELRKIHSDLDGIRYTFRFAELMRRFRPPVSGEGR